MHMRSQIRAAMVSTVTGLTTTGTNVFRSKVYNLDPTQLPCLVVNTNQDVVLDVVMHPPRTQKRELAISVQAVAGASTGIDNVIDKIAEEVEIAVAGNLSLNGTATGLTLHATDISYQSEGDRPYGIAELTYLCRYAVLENEPGG